MENLVDLRIKYNRLYNIENKTYFGNLLTLIFSPCFLKLLSSEYLAGNWNMSKKVIIFVVVWILKGTSHPRDQSSVFLMNSAQ